MSWAVGAGDAVGDGVTPAAVADGEGDGDPFGEGLAEGVAEDDGPAEAVGGRVTMATIPPATVTFASDRPRLASVPWTAAAVSVFFGWYTSTMSLLLAREETGAVEASTRVGRAVTEALPRPNSARTARTWSTDSPFGLGRTNCVCGAPPRSFS